MSKKQINKSNIPLNALDFQTDKNVWTRIYTGKVNGKFVHDVRNKETNEVRRSVEDEKISKYFNNHINENKHFN